MVQALSASTLAASRHVCRRGSARSSRERVLRRPRRPRSALTPATADCAPTRTQEATDDADPQTQPDLKPRSREVTDGLERAAARGMLRAVGMRDEDFAKPQIGIASSWNEITPCNLSLQRLAQAAKEGVHRAGGFPMEFGTISVSDGISMGHVGMHCSLVSREVIADSVETVVQAERLDGTVLLAGCDKSLPGMLMAAARLDVSDPAVAARFVRLVLLSRSLRPRRRHRPNPRRLHRLE